MDMNKIYALREKTGVDFMRCKKALELANDDETIAYEYLVLKCIAVNRRKRVNGVLVDFNENDYLEEAKKIAQQSGRKEV